MVTLLTRPWQRIGQWLPAFDVALLQAGEQSGRLEACFRLLADYYTDRARLARQVIADLAYPAFLFHFAIFILPFAKFFTSGNWLTYLFQTIGVLIPIYAAIALIIYAAQSRHGEKWRGWMECIIHPIPILGTARRYPGALTAGRRHWKPLLSAGVTVIQALGAGSHRPAVHLLCAAWCWPGDRLWMAGQTPAEALNASGRFPELFANQYATGEISGKLDDNLRRLHTYYQEGRFAQHFMRWHSGVRASFISLWQ